MEREGRTARKYYRGNPLSAARRSKLPQVKQKELFGEIVPDPAATKKYSTR